MNRNFTEKFGNIDEEIKSLAVVVKKNAYIDRRVTSLEAEDTHLTVVNKQKRS